MERAVPAARASRWVQAIGWSCVGLGVILLGSAGMSLAVWRLVPEAFDPASSSLGPRLPGMEWIRSHWVPYALVQAALGAAHVAIGWGFARLRAWARAALEALCWILLAGTLASSWGLRRAPGNELEALLTILVAILGVAQLVGLAGLIHFLRRRETRSAFAAPARGGVEPRSAEPR